MAKTKFVIEGLAPHASMARTSDFLTEIQKVFEAHNVAGFFVTTSGPFPASYVERDRTNDGHSEAGNGTRARRADAEAADEFARDGAGGGADEAGSGDGKPARGRGRPRKSDAAGSGDGSAEAAGKAPGESGRRPRGSAQAGDAPERDGHDKPAQGRQRGGGEGEGRERQGSRSGGRAGGADGRDVQAARVADEDAADEFGRDDAGEFGHDEAQGEITPESCASLEDPRDWPDELMPEGEVTRKTISALCADHFKATGGKDKQPTFDLMFEVTGADEIGNVSPGEYDILARALLLDAAKYTYGLKRAAKPSAK